MNEEEVVARYRERQKQLRKQPPPEVVDKPPQEEESDLDPGRLAAAIGFETSVGLATDAASTFLGFAPPIYALANFVSGAGANAIAQFIRGEKGINLGELLSAGAIGIIPGSTIQTGKNLSKFVGKAGTLKRAALAGGVQAVGGEALRIGIDEQRLLSVKEALLGGAIGGTASSGMQQILKTSPRLLNTLGKRLTPGPLRIARGDLIGAARFGGTSGGVKMSPTIGGSGGSGNNPLGGNEFTQKFIKQPWEQFQSRYPGTLASQNKMLTQLTGFGTKLNAPQPKGASYKLIRSQGPGNQPKSIIKDDIDLTNRKDFKFDTPEQAQESANKFKRQIIRLMQVDRIRGEDAGTLAGVTTNPTKVKAITGNLEDIGRTYYDYLTGYFNRFIRRGTVDNFKEAVKLKIPKIKKGQLQPELDTVQGNVSLVRELRLFTMAPDVYESGAFKVKSPSYQAKLKTLIRKYSSVDAPKTYNERRDIFEYRFDAHHIDQVAEGWPLYRGLPKEEIPKMRALLRSFGLEPGNHDDNVLLLLNKFHKDYHNIYWPKAYAKLKAEGDGWDIDVIRSLQTASERYEYARRYAEAINESRDEVVEAINRNLDELAAKKNKTRAQLTEAEVDQISIDLEDIGDEVPADIAAQMAEDAGINDVTRWRDYEN